jgi:hypothetical protein
MDLPLNSHYPDQWYLVTIGAPDAWVANTPVYFVALSNVMKNDNSDLAYFEMELGVQGIIFNSSTFTYEIQRITTGITFYSFDGRNYISTAYTSALTAILTSV